jgi:predicted Zn-dependent protease
VQDQDNFLAQLDGLVVGENPAEGVFRKGRFLHSGLKFSLQFPKGWKVQNTRRAVNSRSSDRKSTFTLELDGDGEDPKLAANDYALTKGVKLGFQPISGRAIRLGTLNGYRLSGKALSAEGRGLDIEMTFIGYGGKIYRVTGATHDGAFARHKGTFRSAARSFRALTKEELKSIQVARLRIVRAELNETFHDLSKRTGNVWSVQKTAVFNGLSPATSLSEGQRVKIALEEPYVEIAE